MRHAIDVRRILVVLGLAALATGAGLTPARAAGAAPAADLFGPTAPGMNLPGEDAVVLFSADTFTLHPDGRIDTYRHRLVRLQSEYAIDDFGDPRVPYDSLLQEVVVHTCRAYTRDGRRLQGTLTQYDDYMNLLLEDVEEYAGGKPVNKYKMLVVKGGNVQAISL